MSPSSSTLRLATPQGPISAQGNPRPLPDHRVDVGIALDALDQPHHPSAFIDPRPDEWPRKDEGTWEPLAFLGPEITAVVTETMLKHGHADEGPPATARGATTRLTPCLA